MAILQTFQYDVFVAFSNEYIYPIHDGNGQVVQPVLIQDFIAAHFVLVFGVGLFFSRSRRLDYGTCRVANAHEQIVVFFVVFEHVGPAGVLNLAQNKIREGTTVAHEMGHMMGFRSKNQQDDSHISDDDIWNSLDGPTKIPLMYSGGEFINRIGERTRTDLDLKGLNIWNAAFLDENDHYIGEEITNKIDPVQK